MGEKNPILQVEQVSKAFGGLEVTRDVSFSVEAANTTALIGPNGAGKTMLFNLISGVYRVDAGRILIDGHEVTHLPSRKRIEFGAARSFQNVRLMQHMTVLENVLLGQHWYAAKLTDLFTPYRFRKRHPWQQQAHQALAEAGLQAHADAAVDTLPYGVRKRVDLVRAEMARPKLLLLDEPAAGLNPTETEQLTQALRRLTDRGITLLIVEHDMRFVHALCGHVIVLNFGEKIAEGSMAEIQRDPQVREAYLGSEVGGHHAA